MGSRIRSRRCARCRVGPESSAVTEQGFEDSDWSFEKGVLTVVDGELGLRRIASGEEEVLLRRDDPQQCDRLGK